MRDWRRRGLRKKDGIRGGRGSVRSFLRIQSKMLIEEAGSNPPPFSRLAYTKLSDILNSTFFQTSIALRPQLSVIVKGARGAGKRSLIEGIADDIGFNIITVSSPSMKITAVT